MISPFWKRSSRKERIFVTTSLLIALFCVQAMRAHAADNCRFRTSSAALDLGLLDPTNPLTVQATTTMFIRCSGSSQNIPFSITDDNGLYESGPNANRMRHLTIPTEFIHYSLSYVPASGTIPRNTDQSVVITCSVTGVDYQGAAAGNYSDSVILSIVP